MKRRVFEVLNAVQPGDRVAQTIDVLLTLLIVLNVLALILSTMDDIFRTAPRAFRLFEIASVIVFTMEYAARVWSCTTDPRYSGPLRGRLRFMASPLVAIDAAAIMPFYILMFIGTGALDLRALRILRLVARVARLTRYSEGIRSLTAAVGGRSQELLTTVGLMLVLLLLASSLMYFVENDAQPEKCLQYSRRNVVGYYHADYSGLRRCGSGHQFRPGNCRSGSRYGYRSLCCARRYSDVELSRAIGATTFQRNTNLPPLRQGNPDGWQGRAQSRGMSGIRRRVIATNAEHLDGLYPIRRQGNFERVVLGDRQGADHR